MTTPPDHTKNLPDHRMIAAAGSPDILVVIFARGAMDGLNAVVPFGDKEYAALRPTIGIPPPAVGGGDGKTAVDLDGFFSLHPALNPLKPAWDAGQLAVVHACGSPDPTHSHFDAQDFMERGWVSGGSTPKPVDGWINRCLQSIGMDNKPPLRAVAVGTMLPVALQGKVPAIAMRTLEDFRLGGTRGTVPAIQKIGASLKSYFPGGTELARKAELTFEALQAASKLAPEKYAPRNGAKYPEGEFGQGLLTIARLIRGGAGLETAAIDLGGWDTHFNEGGVQGQFSRLLGELSGGLAAFHTDLADLFSRISVVVMTEFGRRAAENGSGGSDHGHGSVMFLLSGGLAARKVHGQWPGLGQAALYGPGDLAVTTDYRQVLTELLQNRLALAGQVFPGFTPGPELGIFKKTATG